MNRPGENKSDNQQDDLDRIIHEPGRLKILTQLYVLISADYAFLMNTTGMTWGNLSSHLKKLSDAGYVIIEKSFVDNKPHTMVHLTKTGRGEFEKYRSQMKSLLD